MTSDVMRLARTIAQLRPAQFGQRLRLRSQRMVLHRWPAGRRWLLSGPGPESGPGWPAGFTPLDARVWRGWPGRALLQHGKVDLLGDTRAVAPFDTNGTAACWAAADWEMSGAPLLWRFHLYYWDWAWSLAAGPDHPGARALFGLLWQSWHATVRPGRGTAWRPYPVALRAWSFCGIYDALVRGSAFEAAFRSDLAAQTGFLRRNLETDVGGNHLIKNLKALAGLAVFFGDAALLDGTLSRLDQQLAVQVLPDGGHYERAPTYHCQVLGDLIDVAGLLAASGHEPSLLLEASIDKMRRWLGAIQDPTGDVPPLNDGFPVSRELMAGLQPAAPPVRPLVMLPDTGLARATAGSWDLLADAGEPCPRDLPAHAHADTLACLVHVDKIPLLVDTGTSTYTAGLVRDYERSTAAHNTLEIDDQDSTEVWGAFRAGRRARVQGLSATADRVSGTVTIEASHDGYRHLPGAPRHHRRWSLTERGLRIDDLVTGQGRHRIVLRWHLAPGAQVRLTPDGAVVTTTAGAFDVTVSATEQPSLATTSEPVSAGHGCTVPAPTLTCTLHPKLPVRISTAWHGPISPQELM